MEPTRGISMIEQNAESIFGQAIEIQADEERATLLKEICGENQQLRAEVEKLVADRFR
jgi:hypothetical protein